MFFTNIYSYLAYYNKSLTTKEQITTITSKLKGAFRR